MSGPADTKIQALRSASTHIWQLGGVEDIVRYLSHEIRLEVFHEVDAGFDPLQFTIRTLVVSAGSLVQARLEHLTVGQLSFALSGIADSIETVLRRLRALSEEACERARQDGS